MLNFKFSIVLHCFHFVLLNQPQSQAIYLLLPLLSSRDPDCGWVIEKYVGQKGSLSVLIFAVANLVGFSTRAIAKNCLLYWSSKSHLPMKNASPKRCSDLLVHVCKTQKLCNASVGEGIQVSNRKIKEVQYADETDSFVCDKESANELLSFLK